MKYTARCIGLNSSFVIILSQSFTKTFWVGMSVYDDDILHCFHFGSKLSEKKHTMKKEPLNKGKMKVNVEKKGRNKS